MQHITLAQAEFIPWYACGLYFAASYLNVKHTKKEESAGSRIVRYAPMVLAGFLLANDHFRVGFLGMRFIPDELWIDILGVVISTIGMAFTIWARATLSDNWSPNITLKEQHKLIRTGPYALVRHPIYTGFSFALIGAVLQIGEYRAIVAFLILLISHIMKARQEEKLMSSQFGDQYLEYRKDSGFLIPRFR